MVVTARLFATGAECTVFSWFKILALLALATLQPVFTILFEAGVTFHSRGFGASSFAGIFADSIAIFVILGTELVLALQTVVASCPGLLPSTVWTLSTGLPVQAIALITLGAHSFSWVCWYDALCLGCFWLGAWCNDCKWWGCPTSFLSYVFIGNVAKMAVRHVTAAVCTRPHLQLIPFLITSFLRTLDTCRRRFERIG